MTTKVLITGATGFIGSHLVRRLVRKDYSVNILVRPQSNLNVIGDVLASSVVHTLDGTQANLNEVVSNVKPDLVIHLATLFISEHKADDVRELISTNVTFPAMLLEAMDLAQVHHLINAETSWQFFNDQLNSPVNLYAATKHAFNSILQYYVEARAFRVNHLVIYDTYGPNDPRVKLFSFLLDSAKTAREVAFSPGDQKIDLVYIDDVIDAFEQSIGMITSQNTGVVRYALRSREKFSLKDVVLKFENLLGTKISIVWGGKPYRSREVMNPSTLWETLPNWTPKVSLDEGLKNLIDHAKESESQDI